MYLAIFIALTGAVICYKFSAIRDAYRHLVTFWTFRFMLKDILTQNSGESSYLLISPLGTSASLTYKNGKKIVLLPFDQKKVVEMAEYSAHLYRENEEPLCITQEPGLPYMVTAKSLGGTHILLTNMGTEAFHKYDLDVLPMYGEEIKE